MLGKLLLTILVIVIAFFYVRQRKLAENSQISKANNSKRKSISEIQSSKAESNTLSKDLRLGAYMFLVLTIGLGCSLYYFDWKDDHSILTITLHRDNQEAVIYQVFKYQLGNRSFTTLDGILVTLASSERMEVEGLNP